MKNCKKCGNIIPARIFKDEKIFRTTTRVLCFECSPIKNKSIGDIDGDKTCACNFCGKIFNYKRSVGHSKNMCASCRTKKRRKIFKQRSVDLLGGKCVKCGYNRCINALELHHKIPKEKSFNFNDGYSRSWEVFEKEVLKCILLCSNCHAEEHSNEFNNK